QAEQTAVFQGLDVRPERRRAFRHGASRVAAAARGGPDAEGPQPGCEGHGNTLSEGRAACETRIVLSAGAQGRHPGRSPESWVKDRSRADQADGAVVEGHDAEVVEVGPARGDVAAHLTRIMQSRGPGRCWRECKSLKQQGLRAHLLLKRWMQSARPG